ncbi:unnamed protein product [Paramecium sonneborni]|uniref:Uncharacterized protein n=1 Tax=Paramecium sonneborni TaxID=65129 RepID=A0A8S1R6H4_9CILI|nr:unnamed protein product [Paramecium sonneborni]
MLKIQNKLQLGIEIDNKFLIDSERLQIQIYRIQIMIKGLHYLSFMQ